VKWTRESNGVRRCRQMKYEASRVICWLSLCTVSAVKTYVCVLVLCSPRDGCHQLSNSSETVPGDQ
jgi:hypothetical protein